MAKNDQVTVFIDEKKLSEATMRFATHEIELRCGKTGGIAEAEKREGDMKTPFGKYKLKQVFYRADKVEKPKTILPVSEITPDMGWCDDPADPAYNTLIKKPYAASHEDMYREDDVYDIVVEISHNDNPPVPGLGSAVFLHLMRPEKTGTAGCLAFTHENLRFLLDNVTKDTVIEIRPKPAPSAGIA